jgi:preprotein translocase subunit YajC
MEYKVGDKVIIYKNFAGKVKSIEKGILLVKLNKGGLMNCHIIYAIKDE